METERNAKKEAKWANTKLSTRDDWNHEILKTNWIDMRMFCTGQTHFHFYICHITLVKHTKWVINNQFDCLCGFHFIISIIFHNRCRCMWFTYTNTRSKGISGPFFVSFSLFVFIPCVVVVVLLLWVFIFHSPYQMTHTNSFSSKTVIIYVIGQARGNKKKCTTKTSFLHNVLVE